MTGISCGAYKVSVKERILAEEGERMTIHETNEKPV
jgi:hypothetical protein